MRKVGRTTSVGRTISEKHTNMQNSIPPCSSWDCHKKRWAFCFNGYDDHKLTQLLDTLLRNTQNPDNELMQMIICAKNVRGYYRASNLNHLEKAITVNNKDIVKTFLTYFRVTKEGFPIHHETIGLLGEETLRYHQYIGDGLKAAIKTSEEMTKLVIDGGFNPMVLSENICTTEPGCAYFKEARKLAEKNNGVYQEKRISDLKEWMKTF